MNLYGELWDYDCCLNCWHNPLGMGDSLNWILGCEWQGLEECHIEWQARIVWDGLQLRLLFLNWILWVLFVLCSVLLSLSVVLGKVSESCIVLLPVPVIPGGEGVGSTGIKSSCMVGSAGELSEQRGQVEEEIESYVLFLTSIRINKKELMGEA
ncbi:hypothetical protein LOK49_LG05G03893 [Camellia lanceoleosa]|uniref:Uncharacterized protein n=1 Tax=Camellia lanceoleosa TaxID=1840588 RepID=A0ACC0HSP1_9ERIC|nr:hypothetical protein LOK49_LG05G03893 [Camellia lanceoleosa]